MKESLIETNPHLRDPQERAAMLLQQALDSFAFEGMTGLDPQPRRRRSVARMAPSKKRAIGSTSGK